MSKIPKENENPIDNVLTYINNYTTPIAYNLGISPNMITTLSNIACIITILLLLKANYYWAALFFMLSYYFDCMDGFMARKYNMITVFGDYYDHISDLVKMIAVLYTLYYINPNKFFKIIPVIILLFILMGMHMGCQELYYDSDESTSINITKQLCPISSNHKNEISETMKITRFFGCGTFNISVVLAIIYYDF